MDEENPSQNNLFTPKSQDDSPSSKIQFNSSEKINRNYSWVGPTNETLSFETPVEYDTFSADLDLQVMGTINEEIVESSNAGGYSRSQQAQSFIIDSNVKLLSFSISILKKAEIYPLMQIRNNTYNGTLIHSFTPLFIEDVVESEWINIIFSEQIILTPSTYYLWIQQITNSESSWEKSSDNDTDTWEYITSWNPANYDLTLIVNTSAIIDPEDVDMKINDVPVINTENGEGFVKILGEINSSNTELTVHANESISFIYSIYSVFYRNYSIQQYETQIQEDLVDWNLTLDSGYFDYPYFDYKVNISGIKDDYEDIQVFNQTNVIGYTLISSEIIKYYNEATHILFKSQNYIDSVNLNDNLQIGSIVTINVSVKEFGDIYIYIWDEETLMHQNSSYNVSDQIFQWYMDPNLEANSYVVEIFFKGSNQIGYYSQIINLIKLSEIITTPISGYTLDNFTFSCLYRDYYSQLPISDGIITYSFGELSGVMDMDIYGNYSNSIDLSQYGILPGEYSISIMAEKENYGLIYSEIPIVINPRIVTIELSKSSTTITPRGTIDFEINLKDIEDEPFLIRPVDIQIKIYYSGSHASGDLVYNELLEGINNKEPFSWEVPSNIEEGSYDIVIEINSDYYTGILNLDGAIEVKSSTFWIISLPILIGLVSSLVAGSFIQKEKVKKSLLGLMILHENGAPLAEKISYSMKKSDSALVSGAFIGILSLIKEITGSRLRTIEIDGGYVNLINGKSFWLILFIKDNPKWIEKVIVNLRDEIQLEYGKQIIDFNGKPLDISMDDIIKKYFKTKILTEPPVTED